MNKQSAKLYGTKPMGLKERTVGTNKRHLLVLAIAIASLYLHVNSSMSLGQQLRFMDGAIAPSPTDDEPNAPPNIEAWLLGKAQPTSESASNGLVATAQFSELESAIPGALNEASLPQPDASVSVQTDPVSGGTPSVPFDGSFPNEATIIDGNFVDGEIPYAPMADGYVDQMDVDSTVHFSTNANYRRGYWYSEQDFVMLLRTEIQDLLLSFDAVGGATFFGFNEDMSITDASFTYEPGIKITVGRLLGQDMAKRDYAFEFSYLGLFEYEGSSSIAADGSSIFQNNGIQLFSNIDTALGQGKPEAGQQNGVPGFDNAVRHTVDYQGDYDSLELNYKILGRPNRDRLAMQPSGVWVRHATPSRIKTGLLGFRYISINDYVQYRAMFIDPTRDRGNYLLRTQNDMFGLQIGGSASEVYTNWSWGIKFKTGLLVNMVGRNSEVRGRSGGVPFDRSQFVDDEYLAISVDAGFNASYQFRPNMAARVGYDFSYITGIAAASQNMDLAPEFPKLDLTGDVFLHGLSVGLEFMY